MSKNTVLNFAILIGSFFSQSVLAATSAEVVNSDGERVPKGEREAIVKVVELIGAGVVAELKQSGEAKRDAHHKAHGCVRGAMRIKSGLPTELAQGIFAQASDYETVIRFSNGSGKSQDDHDGDGRGMAIKLLNVPGVVSQDFLMINHPVFFVRNAADYIGFQEAAMSGSLWKWLLNPRHLFHETLIANAIQGKSVRDPLNTRYWSMTASKLGPKQMKFSAQPCAGTKTVDISDSRDLLRENMTAHLAAQAACFDFKLQLRNDPAAMPIEDPTIEWSESRSPFVTVARIEIPPQEPVVGEACQSLAFTPWNSLPEHRPLGGISRVRKEVYETVAKFRGANR